MRDPKRIPKILKELQEIWEKNPDLRLGQLISNASIDRHLYFMEDVELLSNIKRVYK